MSLPSILNELLTSVEQVNFTPIVLAVVLGGAVGLEREVHGRPAGLRTHIMVCLTATILVMTGRDLSHELGQPLMPNGRLVYDPNRLAAGIVTGIGFLGAAAVIRAGDLVRGITTGACVWAVAGLGIVIGMFEYGIAIVATITYLLVLVVLNWLSRPISPLIYRQVVLRGVNADMADMAEDVRAILSAHKIRVQDLHGKRGSGDELFELIFNIRLRQKHQAPEMLELLSAQRGVVSVEWSGLAH